MNIYLRIMLFLIYPLPIKPRRHSPRGLDLFLSRTCYITKLIYIYINEYIYVYIRLERIEDFRDSCLLERIK